jgi:hypothetical protein
VLFIVFLVTLIYTLRICVRDILAPIYEYLELDPRVEQFLETFFYAQEIIAGFTDFLSAVMLLFLFYSYR